MRNIFKFLKIVLSDFRNAGMLAPTTRFTIRKIIRAINSDVKTIIEYGPGSGVVTKALLSILPADGKLIAVEIKPEFIEYLKKIDDPRLQIVSGDIVKVSQDFPKADVVVSGVPFSFFSKADREMIVKRTAEVLSDGGVFVAYQHSLALLKLMKRFFNSTSWTAEFRNFPTTMFIMSGRKPVR